jgi:hypothetical protein
LQSRLGVHGRHRVGWLDADQAVLAAALVEMAQNALSVAVISACGVLAAARAVSVSRRVSRLAVTTACELPRVRGSDRSIE